MIPLSKVNFGKCHQKMPMFFTLIGRQVAGAICATVLGSSIQTAEGRDKVCIFRAISRVDNQTLFHTAGVVDHKEIGGGKQKSSLAQYQGWHNIYLHNFPMYEKI